MSNPEQPENRRHVTIWETVAVTALPPGWRNVYREKDDGLIEDLCPAILVQEARAESVSWDEYPAGKPARRSRRTVLDPPYETRAVFADIEMGHLCVAVSAINYAGTIGPGQSAAEVAAQ
jgi:hypothetical protein